MKFVFILLSCSFLTTHVLGQTLNLSGAIKKAPAQDYVVKLKKWVALDSEDWNLSVDYIDEEKHEMVVSGVCEAMTGGLASTTFNILKPYISFSIEFGSTDSTRTYTINKVKYIFKPSYENIHSLSTKSLKMAKNEMEEIIAHEAQFVIDESFDYSMKYLQNKMNNCKAIYEDEKQKKKVKKRNIELYQKYEIQNNVYQKIVSDIKHLQSRITLILIKL